MINRHRLKALFLTLLGTTVAALGLSMFLTPNKIVCGGISGIAIVLYYTIKLPMGITVAVLNLLLLLAGWRILGKPFIVKTTIGAGLFSLMVQLTSYIPPATDDVVIASIFGGVIYGLGLGITLASGASSGGTDILGRIMQHYFPHIPIGKLLMVADGAVIMISLIVFRQVNLVFYGVIALFVETIAIDWLIRTLNISKVAYVITNKGDDIKDYLIKTSTRGVTMLKGKGGYTMEDKDVLFCALKNSEIDKFEKKIKSIDSTAFVVFTEAQQIVGKGFKVYR